MPGQRINDAAFAELRRELKALSDQGAGIAELLDEVRRRNVRRFGRRRLSKVQRDQLARYCWSLQQSKPNGLLWGRARELWGDRSALRTTRLGSGSGRRRATAADRLPRST
jgi:hypothetical protein